MSEKYNILTPADETTLLDKFAIAALPAAMALIGQNQPHVVAAEAYSVAKAMVEHRKQFN